MEQKFIIQYAPYLVPFLGAIFLIIFTKKYLFSGMISADMHKEQLEREKELVRVQEEVSMRLTDVVDRQVMTLDKIEKLVNKLDNHVSEVANRPCAWTGEERRKKGYV